MQAWHLRLPGHRKSPGRNCERNRRHRVTGAEGPRYVSPRYVSLLTVTCVVCRAHVEPNTTYRAYQTLCKMYSTLYQPRHIMTYLDINLMRFSLRCLATVEPCHLSAHSRLSTLTHLLIFLELSSLVPCSPCRCWSRVLHRSHLEGLVCSQRSMRKTL